MEKGGVMGGWRRLNGGVCRLPAFPTVVFVVIHQWFGEPPSLCKSVFASQVFAVCSQARDFPYISPCTVWSKGQRRNNTHGKSGN